MSKIGVISFMAAWCLLPSFVWLRGMWRNNLSDRMLGVCLLAVFAFLSLFEGTTGPMNIDSAWVLALGILTLVVSPFGKRLTFHQALPYGTLLIILALCMALLV